MTLNGRTLSSFAGRSVAALALALAAASQAAAANASPPAPVVAPAVHAVNAAQATMLAATRAGARIVAVGDHGIVLLSDDGGKSHRQAKLVPLDATLTSITFIDEKLGWAA